MYYKHNLFFLLPFIILLTSCSAGEAATDPPKLTQPGTSLAVTEAPTALPNNTEVTSMNPSQFADVLSVQVTGQPGAYTFAVEISSPDTGCEQFADWWEVVSQDGQLLYRRILLHSHVDEQPFVRSGGPVEIEADIPVFVRAHMNTSGYGGAVMQGTVQGGFEPAEVESGFGSDLERVPPQPEDCAF